MNCLQKLLILGKASNDVERSNIETLFALLDKYGIEYHTLAIHIIDLDLDDLFPVDAYKYVAEDFNFNKLMQLTIKFDVYIPIFKWVFNIHQTVSRDDVDLTSKMIKEAFETERTKDNQLEDRLRCPIIGVAGKAIEWAGKPIDSNKQVLEALRSKFDREGLHYPGIGHGYRYGSMPMDNSDLTFDAINLNSLEDYIKKSHK